MSRTRAYRGRRLWSAEEVAALIRLRTVDCLPYTIISEKLNRPANSCQQKFVLETTGNRRRSKFGPKNTNAAGDVIARVPASTLAERDRRIALRDSRTEEQSARGDVTSIIFGDPPPGYSALDRKRQAEANA